MTIIKQDKLPASLLVALTFAMLLLVTACTDDNDDPVGPAEELEITSVEPDSGAVGTEVVIFGSGFSATPSNNTVTFDGIEAPVHRASTDSLHTEVPEGATDGPIEVTVAGETATGPDFNVIDTTSQ